MPSKSLGIQNANELQGILMPVAELAQDGLLPDWQTGCSRFLWEHESGRHGSVGEKYTAIRMVKGVLDMAYAGVLPTGHVALYRENDVLEV